MLGRTHTDFTPLLTPVLSSSHGPTAHYCLQHTTLRLCFSLQFFLVPNISQCQPFAQFSEHSGNMWNISKMGAEQRRNKKYWRWKDDAPEAGPFATPVPPPSPRPCTQPPPPPPPSQCTRALTSSPWKRYYRALPPLVESWGRHVLIRLLHSLLCAVLLLLLEKRTRGNVEAAVVQPQTAPSLDVALQCSPPWGVQAEFRGWLRQNWYQRLLAPF